MSDAILFDFNGVLVDDEEQHRVAVTHAAERIGLTVAREWYYDRILGCDDAAGMPCVMLTTSHPAAAFPDADAVRPSLAGRGPADVRSLLDR